MTGLAPLNLNLAGRPRRNRRLYFLLTGGLLALLVLLAAGAVLAVWKFGGELSRLKASSSGAEKLRLDAQREERRLSADFGKQERLFRIPVDFTNGLILRKTFRWTGLLTALEESLPASSYLTFLSPNFAADNVVGLRLRVASRSLDDLTALIDGLSSRGFKAIQVFDESRGEDGRIITEISATYERPL